MFVNWKLTWVAVNNIKFVIKPKILNFFYTCPPGDITFFLMIKIKKKVMETRVNLIGYCISSTNRPRRLFDFKALVKVFKRRRCLFKRKTTYLNQVLTISQGLFPINNKQRPLWFIYLCIQGQLSITIVSMFVYTYPICI